MLVLVAGSGICLSFFLIVKLAPFASFSAHTLSGHQVKTMQWELGKLFLNILELRLSFFTDKTTGDVGTCLTCL